MADSTIQKFTLIQLTGANAYAAMLASQAAAAASATAAAASAASAASAVNTAVSGTVNTIAKFSGTNAVRNSTISDDGTTVSVSATYLQMSNAAPSLVFHESDAGTDGKRWQMSANSGVLTLYTTNDANSASATAWQVTRSGNSITQHQFFVGGAERLSLTDSINLSTAGSTRMRIYADGGVQIGGTFGTSPGAGVTRIGNNTIQQGSIEVNEKGIGNRYAYIDLVGDDTYVDYGMRIIREATGPNTTSVILHRGTGVFGLTAQDAAPISISTSFLERMRIYPDGGVQIGGTFGTSPGTGKLRVETALNVGTNQVVSARDTGWTAMTGTANKNTAYDTASVTLAQLAGRVMSLQAALTTHGLIGA